jgi:hypothetical protein
MPLWARDVSFVAFTHTYTPSELPTAHPGSMSHLQTSRDANAQFSRHNTCRMNVENNLQMRQIFGRTGLSQDTKRTRKREVRAASIRLSNSTALIVRFIVAYELCVINIFSVFFEYGE